MNFESQHIKHSTTEIKVIKRASFHGKFTWNGYPNLAMFKDIFNRKFAVIASISLLALMVVLTAPAGRFVDLKASAQSVGVTPEETAVISVVQQASPAVVSIVATQQLPVIERQQNNPLQDFCSDPYFRRYFSDECSTVSPSPTASVPTAPQQVAAGTGFIISANGLILTNKHVVDIDGANYTVILNDGRKFPAQILMRDPGQDIAIVKINANDLPSLNLGNSDSIMIGETGIAIGNALGQFSNTVSKGIVSGLSRTIMATGGSGGAEQLTKVIQTDAAINLGNSGGPLLNLSGQVIGINTAIVQGAQNIGFAIPINAAKDDVSKVTR